LEVKNLVREDAFPRYDVQEYGQLITNTIAKVLADLKKLGVTHAVYWSYPWALPKRDDYITRIEVPVDQFPYKSTGVDVSVDSNVDKFDLTLRIAEGKAVLEAEMTLDELLTSRRGILDALSADAVLKLVNALENWVNNRHKSIQDSHHKDPARMSWYLAEPDLLWRKQMCKELHSVLVRKEEQP
jgi:hypothetical protein